jgi:hypothetical protein
LSHALSFKWRFLASLTTGFCVDLILFLPSA